MATGHAAATRLFITAIDVEQGHCAANSGGRRLSHTRKLLTLVNLGSGSEILARNKSRTIQREIFAVFASLDSCRGVY
jgi:hypothetical protein